MNHNLYTPESKDGYSNDDVTEQTVNLGHGLPRFRKAVYVSAVVAAIGGFVCGYDTGAVGSILAIEPFKERFFTEDNYVYLQGLLLALFLTTATVGAFSAGYFSDRFSRKYCIIAASFIYTVGILLEIIGDSFGMLLAGRIVGGLGSGLMNTAIPLYHSEIAPADIRGRLISFFTLMSYFGQVVGYFVSFGTNHFTNDWSWRIPFIIQIIICALFGCLITILPFSPRWLIDKQRYDEAKIVLADLYEAPISHPIVNNVYEAILTELEFERSLGDRSYLELFQGSNLRRTMLAFFISIGTSFTGSVAIWYYAPQIFISAGLDDVSTSLATTGGTGLFNLAMAAISLFWFIDRWGRKPIFIVGAIVMGISMFIVGVMFHVYTVVDVDTYSVTILNPHARNTIIAFIYIFTGAYAFSWGTVSYVYPAEIFNMRTRAKGLSLTYSLNWAFSILFTYCVPLFIEHTVSGVYFFFGSSAIVLSIACLFIPETKGRTLEEMEVLFKAI
ncbi:general substrate transporter [Pilobolus umbonatus]|nr:general substrate transporter [Pilobolus umbonatus]